VIISGAIIAHKLLADNEEISDNVSCELPSVELDTAEIKGAGILGTIDMPATGQLGSMAMKMDFRSTNKKIAGMAKNGKQNIELRFVRDTVTATGSVAPEGSKIFATGIVKKYDLGKVEDNSTQESSFEFEILRYRQVIAGKEVLLIDKQNYIYKINGVDYMQQIRSLL